MIPRDYINEWRERAPWNEDFQVEQDRVISRAMVKIFSDPVLAESLAFRGGTALYKLYLTPPARYSEDIDLVQVEPGPAGPLMDRLRSALDPWLGQAQWKQSRGRVTFGYRFWSEDVPAMRLRLKVEINTREHFADLALVNPNYLTQCLRAILLHGGLLMVRWLLSYNIFARPRPPPLKTVRKIIYVIS